MIEIFRYGKCIFARPKIENVDDMVEMMNDESIQSMLSTKKRVITKEVAIYYVREGGKYAIHVSNTWKSNPKYHSFDILGARWDNFKQISNYSVSGTQTPLSGSSIEYNETSSGDHIKKFNYGSGLSQNLIDNVTPLINFMKIKSEDGSDFGTNVYGTYQHASKNISLTNSKSYTVDSTGLGGVIKHNYSKSYDGMQGVYTNPT